MIAPLRQTNKDLRTSVEGEGIHRARRLVATLLFSNRGQSPRAPAVARWKAWLLVGWMAAAAAFYLVRMIAALG